MDSNKKLGDTVVKVKISSDAWGKDDQIDKFYNY